MIGRCRLAFKRSSVFVCLLMVFCSLPTQPVALAQDTPPVVDLLSRDRALGPGCNQVGLALDSSLRPIAPTQEWLDDHAVCAANGLRLDALCSGHTEGDRQFELCGVTTLVEDGLRHLGCEQVMIVSDLGPFGPDPKLTDAIVQLMWQEQEERNLPAPLEAIRPCTESPALLAGRSNFAVFDIQRLDAEFALLVNLDGEEWVALVVTEPREELPA
jgi:hypothetical protein